MHAVVVHEPLPGSWHQNRARRADGDGLETGTNAKLSHHHLDTVFRFGTLSTGTASHDENLLIRTGMSTVSTWLTIPSCMSGTSAFPDSTLFTSGQQSHALLASVSRFQIPSRVRYCLSSLLFQYV